MGGLIGKKKQQVKRNEEIEENQQVERLESVQSFDSSLTEEESSVPSHTSSVVIPAKDFENVMQVSVHSSENDSDKYSSNVKSSYSTSQQDLVNSDSEATSEEAKVYNYEEIMKTAEYYYA